MAVQHRQQHGQAVLLQSHRHPTRVAEGAVIHQGLNLDQQRPGASHTTITALPAAGSVLRSRKMAEDS